LISIGNVRLTPPSTREDPYLFEDLVDAAVLSRITGSEIWAICSFDSNLYRIYPGGRTESYPSAVREKWAEWAARNKSEKV
jgi:hypothetical protein